MTMKMTMTTTPTAKAFEPLNRQRHNFPQYKITVKPLSKNDDELMKKIVISVERR